MAWQRHWVIRSREQWAQVTNALAGFEVAPFIQRQPLELILRELYKPKTHSQRKLFHAICADMAPHFDLTPGDMKRLIMANYGGSDMREIAGIWMHIVPSSEELEREEYSALIDSAFQLAAEAGKVVPDRRPT